MSKVITRTFPTLFIYDILDSAYAVIGEYQSATEIKSKRDIAEIMKEYIGGKTLVLANVKEETREMTVETFLENSTVVK